MTVPSEGDALAALLRETLARSDEFLSRLATFQSRRKLTPFEQEARSVIMALAKLARGVRMPGSPDSIPNWPLECLDMIREDLEAFGMDMKGCPPMMYNDALRNLVSTLGLKLGFTTSQEIAALMRAARPPREAAP